MNIIKKWLNELLPQCGFHRKSDTWYRDYEKTIAVINLQKSDFGNQYYVNLGVWVKALGESKFPKENHCHIQKRLCTSNGDELRVNFDDKSISDADREALIRTTIMEHGIPFLEACSTIEGIGRSIASGALKKALVYWQVKDLVHVPDQ